MLGTGYVSVAESNLALLDWTTALLINFRNASLSAVFWLVLAPYRPSLSYRRLFVGLMVAYGLALLLLLAGQIHRSMQINFVMQAVAAIVLMQGLITAGQLPRLLRNTLLIGAGLYIVLLVTGYRVVLDFTQSSTVDLGLLDWRLNGTPIGIFVVWVLLTEHKRRNMVKADEYLKIETSQARLRADAERHSERGAMIDMLTHELKTPLNAILGFSDLMQTMADDLSSAQVREYAGLVHQGGSNLLRLVNQIMDLTKLAAGRRRIAPFPRLNSGVC